MANNQQVLSSNSDSDWYVFSKLDSILNGAPSLFSRREQKTTCLKWSKLIFSYHQILRMFLPVIWFIQPYFKGGAPDADERIAVRCILGGAVWQEIQLTTINSFLIEAVSYWLCGRHTRYWNKMLLFLYSLFQPHWSILNFSCNKTCFSECCNISFNPFWKNLIRAI